LDEAIYIENDIDFETPPKNRETELYMRFQTDIENGENPEFYSDLNGFQYQHRVKVPAIGIEGKLANGYFLNSDSAKTVVALMT
jgi:alpha-mannosidase